MHWYNYQFEYLSFFQKISMKIIDSVTSNENTVFQSQEIRVPLAKFYILSDECGGGMMSIIFIYLAFWMGQQPYIPENSTQMVFPSGHWYFWSGEKTSPEVPMKPLLFNAISTCCEGRILLAFGSIPAVPSRQRLSVLLTDWQNGRHSQYMWMCLSHAFVTQSYASPSPGATSSIIAAARRIWTIRTTSPYPWPCTWGGSWATLITVWAVSAIWASHLQHR